MLYAFNRPFVTFTFLIFSAISASLLLRPQFCDVAEQARSNLVLNQCPTVQELDTIRTLQAAARSNLDAASAAAKQPHASGGSPATGGNTGSWAVFWATLALVVIIVQTAALLWQMRRSRRQARSDSPVKQHHPALNGHATPMRPAKGNDKEGSDAWQQQQQQLQQQQLQQQQPDEMAAAIDAGAGAASSFPVTPDRDDSGEAARRVASSARSTPSGSISSAAFAGGGREQTAQQNQLLSQLLQRQTTMADHMAQMDKDIQYWRDATTSAQTLLQAQVEMVTFWKGRAEEAIKRADDAEAQVAARDASVAELRCANEALSAEACALRVENDQLTQNLSETHTQLQAQRADTRDTHSRLAQLQARLADSEAERLALAGQVEQAIEQLAASEARIAELDAACEALSADKAELERANADLCRQRDEACKQMPDVAQKLGAQLGALCDKYEQAKAVLVAKEDDIVRLNRELQEAAAKVKEQEERMAANEKALWYLKCKVAQLTGSKNPAAVAVSSPPPPPPPVAAVATTAAQS